MAINPYTQPAQQTEYKPSYVAPPMEQLSSISMGMQQQMNTQRQEAQNLIKNLAGIDTAGGDTPRAQQKIQELQNKVSKAAEKHGYNLRSPEFRSEFSNIKNEYARDPFFKVAPQMAKDYRKTREALDKNRYNLPPSIVDNLERRLQAYEQYGSVDEQGNVLPYAKSGLGTVPEDVPDIDKYTRSMLDDVEKTDLSWGKRGYHPQIVGNELGLRHFTDENEEGETVSRYEVVEIPNEVMRQHGQQLREMGKMKLHAEEDVQNMSREEYDKALEQKMMDVWGEYAKPTAQSKASVQTDWSAMESRADRYREAAKAGQYDTLAVEYGTQIFGEDINTADPEAIKAQIGVDNEGRIDLGTTLSQLGKEKPIITKMGKNIGNVGDLEDKINIYNQYDKAVKADKEVKDILSNDRKKQAVKNQLEIIIEEKGQGWTPSVPGPISEMENAGAKFAKLYEEATGKPLKSEYYGFNEGAFEEMQREIDRAVNDKSEAVKDKYEVENANQAQKSYESTKEQLEGNKFTGNMLSGLEGRAKFIPKSNNNKVIVNGTPYAVGDFEFNEDQIDKLLQTRAENIDEDKKGSDFPEDVDQLENNLDEYDWVSKTSDNEGNTIYRMEAYIPFTADLNKTNRGYQRWLERMGDARSIKNLPSVRNTLRSTMSQYNAGYSDEQKEQMK